MRIRWLAVEDARHDQNGPIVSVVIPTARRPELVGDAVRSALAQTFVAIEVIVVLDGRDDETATTLEALGDDRLRVVTLHPAGGGNAARNAAVRAARGQLVALLDDDDTWRPDHLYRLLSGADTANRAWCRFARFEANTALGTEIWPRRIKPPHEPAADYLFDRRRLFHGEALLHPSTMLCPRWVLIEHPFDEQLRRHQDWDWLIRTEHAAALTITVLPDVVAAVRVQDGRARPPFPVDEQLGWIETVRPLISKRAYAGYYLTQIGVRSSATRDIALGRLALSRAIRHGRPRLRHLVVFAILWLVPTQTRRRLRTAVRRRRP